MEKAIFLTRPSQLNMVRPPYSRLYYGNEFCQRLLPSVPQIGKIISFTQSKHIDFSLVTPYVTDEGLGQLKRLFSFLKRAGQPAEVVVNDWGVLWMILRHFPSLKPVLGRLLTKQKRCPTIPMVLQRKARVVYSCDPANPKFLRLLVEKKLPPEVDFYYKGSNAASVPIVQSFLLENGISRIELDNTLQGVMLELASGMHASLYFPFVYTTTTFYCPSAGCETKNGDYRKIRACRKPCQRYGFALRHKSMNKVIFLKGNTHFYQNPLMPSRRLEACGIDRLVYQPDLPF